MTRYGMHVSLAHPPGYKLIDRTVESAKKNAAKVVAPKSEREVQFDPTLRQRSQEEDPETRRLFKEMKKREF